MAGWPKPHERLASRRKNMGKAGCRSKTKKVGKIRSLNNQRLNMEKIETTIKDRENQPAPPPTACKRCGVSVPPKNVPILGWRQQDHCDACGDILVAEREKREMEDHRKMTIESFLARSGIMRGILAQMTFENFNSQLAGKD